MEQFLPPLLLDATGKGWRVNCGNNCNNTNNMQTEMPCSFCANSNYFFIRILSMKSNFQYCRVPMFVPSSSSRLQSLAGWILGRFDINLSSVIQSKYARESLYLQEKLFRRPELVDPRCVARGEGRQVVDHHLSRILIF